MASAKKKPTENTAHKVEPATCDATRQSQLDFEIEFFDRILGQHPGYVDVLRVQANNLTSKGLFARGLALDRSLAQLRPNDPVVHYNLACSLSLMKMSDDAIAALDSSLKLGYCDIEHILSDPDLENVRQDARFVGLIGRHLLKSRKNRTKGR